MSTDTALKESVLTELRWEPSVNAAHIGVTAHDGVITLMGHVQTYAEKHAAEAAARRVRGVKSIAEEIEVKLSFDVKRSDEDIAAAIISRLAWDSTIPKDAVKSSVESGWVTLIGDVDWHFESEAAEQEVRRLWGVVGVTNHIKVRSRVNTYNLDQDITKALQRSWLDPSNVTVTADGGKVKLTGSVHSWSERMLAGKTAWAAPGTVAVENSLAIA